MHGRRHHRTVGDARPYSVIAFPVAGEAIRRVPALDERGWRPTPTAPGQVCRADLPPTSLLERSVASSGGHTRARVSDRSQTNLRSSSMLRLKTFGAVLVERDGQPLGGVAGQRRVLALLALLAVARDKGVSRDRILALLWPEGESERSRQALTQALYHARRALNESEILMASGDVRLNPSVITTDVGEFETAVDRGDLKRAVGLYGGPFLEGFHVSGAPEFERWSSTERARLNDRCVQALEALAAEAEAARDYRTAVERRKQLAAIDPFNSRITMDLMVAMAASGDRAGAIQHARIHETLVREELDVEPGAEFTELLGRLREDPTWTPAIARSHPHAEPVNGGRAVAVPSEGDSAGPHPDPENVTAVPTGRARRWRRAVAAAAIVGIVLSAAMLARAKLVARAPSVAATPVADIVLVAPFRVAGAHPSVAYLREGLVDLLVTKLTDDDADRAADPAAVMSAWRRARLGDGRDVPRAEALRIARQLGTGRLILGSVVGTPERLVISASILGTREGEMRAQATVEGPADSITTLVDRLAARLLAREAGTWEQLASHTSASLDALRAYLDGQAAYRRGGYREAAQHFRRALGKDSTFAMAGLGLAQAAERIGAHEERDHGLAAAWASRGELTERDRTYLDAMAGPRYPQPSSEREQLSAWERAAMVAPNRADVWHELGERLFHDGQWLGLRDWQGRATAAFRRASEVDSSLVSPLPYLVQLAALAGDTAEVRRIAALHVRLDSVGDLTAFVRWRAAAALADANALRALRRTFSTMPAPSLRLIALSSQDDGVEIADAERALLALQKRAVRQTERDDVLLGLQALAMNRGQPARVLEYIDDAEEARATSGLLARLRVLDALYGDGDSTAAMRSAADLASFDAAAANRLTDLCVVEQWRVWRGQSENVRASVRSLSSARPEASADASPMTCGALLEAIVAVREGRRDAMARVMRVDSLLTFGPPNGEMRTYAPLALARLYDAMGQRDRARAAIARRPYLRAWPRYLTTQLRLDGDLALAAGDTAAALRAYTRFLALREDSEARSAVLRLRGSDRRASQGVAP